MAQEHQQSQFFPSLTQQRKQDGAAVSGVSKARNNVYRGGGGYGPTQQSQAYQQDPPPRVNYQPPQQAYQQEPTRINYQPPLHGYNQQEPPRNNYQQEPPRNNYPQEPPRNDYTQERPLHCARKPAETQPGIIYPRPSSTTLANASFASDSTTPNAKSKLPHGLTVQELKEMTKARLQKDADEQRRRSWKGSSKKKQQYQQPPPRREVPLDVRGSPYHMDHVQQHGAPGMNIANLAYVPDRVLSSPLQGGPPGFHSVHSQSSLASGTEISQMQSFGRDGSWQQQQHAKDAWETGSVASHNSTINSEYLGSEYAMDEFTDIPFNRTRSYSNGAGIGGVDRQYEAAGNMGGFYDHGLTPNQNRRRAATLSPRLGLSYLHEDRPSFTGVPELDIPIDTSSHTPISLRQSPPQSNRARIYSENGVVGDGVTFNRPRTASAPSVSSFLAMTGEMFGEACGGLSSVGPEFNHSNSELPNSMVESILGDSSTSLPPNNSDYSSVFRNSSQDAGDAEFKNPWGGGGLGSLSIENESNLALEFGSVLSLSGISAPRDGGFAPQRDLEVSLFPSLGNNDDSVDQHQLHGIYGNQSSSGDRY